MGRLKGIPDNLSPDILHLLAVTGHGDEILLADMNFPTHSLCEAAAASGGHGPKEYRADGLKIPDLLSSILALMPLDWYHPWQMAVMDMTDSDKINWNVAEAPVVSEYRNIASLREDLDEESSKKISIEKIERFQFYEHAKKTYAIIHTGDTTAYANVILKRGVV